MTKRSLPALAPLLLLLGCANLPSIDAGVCGNGIVESGEDCDSSDPRCRKCRIDCSLDADGERPACPSGWACGSDSICRAPSGDFVEHPGPPESALLGSIADFDGDGLSDVVAIEPGGLKVHYFDTTGAYVSAASVVGTPVWPAVGSLTTDGRASMALTQGDISVLRGQSDKSLLPTSYAPFPVQPGLEGYVIMNAMPGIDYLGDEVLAIVRDGNTESVWDVVESQKLFELPGSQSTVLGPIASGDLNEGTPCDELVMTMSGATSVTIYETCRSVGTAGWGWNVGAQAAASVTLPLGFAVASNALLADLNGDGELDLVVRGEKGKVPGLFAAYGAQGSSFDSDPAAGAVVGNGKFSPLSVWGSAAELPLAVGDLNADGVTDLVTPKTVLVSSPVSVFCAVLGFDVPGYECAAYNDGDVWTSAAIADFNANGIPDVMALRKNARRVDFLNGSGKGFNQVELPVEGTATQLVVGDFDGDLVSDAAFKVGGSAANPEDSLTVVYGKPLAAPEAPVSVARLQKIQQLATGNVSPFTGGLFDGVTDIGVLSSSLDGKTQSSAIFFGRTDRQLQSSFTLFSGTEALPAIRSFVGRFDEEPHPDLAVLTAGIGSGPGGEPLGEPTQRLVLVPSTGQAALDQSKAQSASFPWTFEACGALATVVDLDSDGIDEIVFFGLRYDGTESEPSGFSVARSVASAEGGRSFEISPVVAEGPGLVDLWVLGAQCFLGAAGSGGAASGGSAGTDPNAPATDEYLPPGAIQAVDFDADGEYPDILLLGLFPDVDNDVEPKLVLIRNDQGTLDASAPVVLENPTVDGAPLLPISFAALNLDDDPELEVAVTGIDGKVYAMDVDRDAGVLTEPWILADVAGGFALRTGDFNGDGVSDLVSSGQAGLTLLTGVPVLK